MSISPINWDSPVTGLAQIECIVRFDLPIVLSEGATPPSYTHEGDAGMDLFCNAEYIVMPPGKRVAIPTGVRMAIPAGHYGDVRSKSGLAIKHGITCLTGTVDSSYRGEIYVILVNLGESTHRFSRGDKVAQLVIVPCARANIVPVQSLGNTDRGACGFGSTGK